MGSGGITVGLSEAIVVVLIVAFGWLASRLWVYSQRPDVTGARSTVAKVVFLPTIFMSWGTSLLFACWSQYRQGRSA